MATITLKFTPLAADPIERGVIPLDTITSQPTPLATGEVLAFDLDDDGGATVRLVRGNRFASFLVFVLDDGGRSITFTVAKGSSDFHLAFVSTPSAHPTESQRDTIARLWFGDRAIIGAAPDAEVLAWAFEGCTSADISRRYGASAQIHSA